MHLYRKFQPFIVVIVMFAGYIAVFKTYQNLVGVSITFLAIIPVIAASWYLGVNGGILTALACILSDITILTLEGDVNHFSFHTTDYLIIAFSLILIAFVNGTITRIMHERQAAISKLQQYEKEWESHTKFLEQLNQITAKALEANSLQATLEIMTEKIAHLFSANDAYFARWDQEQEIPIPILAFGSMKDIYPFVQFEPGDITLTTSVMKAEHPIPVMDIEHSEYISPNIAAIFPSRSMLAIPLITQRGKLGSILLGYEKKRTFEEEIIYQAELTAEQVALVLSKSQILEDERKQVRQLTALHDVAMVSIEADDEDQLIERVVNIIGQNLFPDNFGIILLDERDGILHAHPSYRFYTVEGLEMKDMRVGEGITGEVARTGLPQRIGNVRRIQQYVDVDDRTISELCVPIKFKERILGVINAESMKRDAFSAEDERMLITLAGQLATALEQFRKAQNERIWLQQLAHSRDLIYSIAQISTRIESSFTREDIVQSLGDELHKIGFTCLMATYDKHQQSFTVNYTSLPPHLIHMIEGSLGYPLLNYSFPRPKMRSIVGTEELLRATIIRNPVEEVRALFKYTNPQDIALILQQIGVPPGTEPIRLPLLFENNMLGFLWVWGKGITNSDLPVLSILAKQIGISLERARLFQEVQNLALTDSLTGLHNRRSIFELGKIEFGRAERMKRSFCCMMLDLDHFKQVNDTHGHQLGDQVLQEFAKRCQNSVREVDLVGRYGGEEIIVLLPETNLDMAVQIAERLRSSLSTEPIKTQSMEVRLTVSIGVAAKDEHTTTLDILIARADQALYVAKHKGRNQVATSV